jgi:hypothetical protein
VETTIKEVGQYLEQQAKLGTPITYISESLDGGW